MPVTRAASTTLLDQEIQIIPLALDYDVADRKHVLPIWLLTMASRVYLFVASLPSIHAVNWLGAVDCTAYAFGCDATRFFYLARFYTFYTRDHFIAAICALNYRIAVKERWCFGVSFCMVSRALTLVRRSPYTLTRTGPWALPIANPTRVVLCSYTVTSCRNGLANNTLWLWLQPKLNILQFRTPTRTVWCSANSWMGLCSFPFQCISKWITKESCAWSTTWSPTKAPSLSITDTTWSLATTVSESSDWTISVSDTIL